MALEIGPIRLESPVILAPMSGVTDLPYRRRVRAFGDALVVSEMIASRAMIHANRRTLRMATPAAAEFPMAVQLAGNEPALMAEAAKMNADRGAAIIDINMGCPAKKVTKGAAGAALMRDERLATDIIHAVVGAVDLPVTLKMRAGWDSDTRNAPALARIAEAEGVQMITVHGRTRAQFYRGAADWAFIGRVKRAVAIPVIGNGDVSGPAEAARLLALSGADGVMIGRASRGRPWLVEQVGRYLATAKVPPEPSLGEQLACVLAHLDDLMGHYGAETGVRVARKHLGWYSKGLPGSAEFRGHVNRIADAAAVSDAVRAFYEPLVERVAA